MQFFIISPIFIVPLYKFKKFGIAGMVLTCLVSFSITIGLIVQNEFDIASSITGISGGGANGRGDLGGSTFTTTVYQKPYCRISVYLVGMGLGLLLHQHRRIRMPKALAVLGWLFATMLAMLVVYGLYPAISEGTSLSKTGNALYGALARCTWGIAVSWVIFACYFGYGGPIDQFLSWKGWVPLSRLTYTAYLIHQQVIYQYYQAHDVPWHLDLIDFCYYFVAITGLTYSMAVLFSLAVEYPFANMEKLFLPGSLQSTRGDSKKDDDTKKDNDV
ncbi:O-acyltransferase like protein-like [Amphiura filiformis]|uniref:O-acyltransferase like protein-like n=1 Tax=Amphiura filiformis TaxID=82378 RepID=UPI003B21EF18